MDVALLEEMFIEHMLQLTIVLCPLKHKESKNLMFIFAEQLSLIKLRQLRCIHAAHLVLHVKHLICSHKRALANWFLSGVITFLAYNLLTH